MNDTAFEQVKSSGIISDDKITDPTLLDVRKETVKRNVPRALKRREQARFGSIKQGNEPSSKEPETAITFTEGALVRWRGRVAEVSPKLSVKLIEKSNVEMIERFLSTTRVFE